MADADEFLAAYRKRTRIPPRFHQVYDYLSELQRNGDVICDGMSRCITTGCEKNIDEEIALTLLIGLQAVQVWYAANRTQYEDSKNFSAGNSGKSDGNAIFVSTRNQNNKFAKRDYESRLILGYMDTFGQDRVRKKFIDPLSLCVQRIFIMPNYFEIKMDRTRDKLAKEIDNLDVSDLKLYRDECEAYRKQEVSKRLGAKVNKFILSFEKMGRASTVRKRAMVSSRKFFKDVHSSRTSVL